MSSLPKMPFCTATLAVSTQPSLTASPHLPCTVPGTNEPYFFHLLTSMDLVTVALQVSHEYRLCWKIAAQRELSYSARKQTKPFIKGEFPGHLSLLSYLYSFLKRKSSTALCLRSKSSSIAGFGSPDAGLQPQSPLQKGL